MVTYRCDGCGVTLALPRYTFDFRVAEDERSVEYERHACSADCASAVLEGVLSDRSTHWLAVASTGDGLTQMNERYIEWVKGQKDGK